MSRGDRERLSETVSVEPRPPQDTLQQCLSIRLFEQRLLRLYSEGHLFGTVHTCVGQEMVGVLAAKQFREGDVFVSNHRGHGHYLGLTDDQEGLLCEVLGREGAVCLGRGGTQHLYHPKGFYSNGIQGGMSPVASGLAMASRLQKRANMVFLFVGDGTLGEGTLYESFNIASKWGLPLLVIVENNGIAQTTPLDLSLAGTIEGRARAFDLDYACGSTRDWEELQRLFEGAAKQVRDNSRPMLLEVITCRLNSHSKGDDTRAAEDIESLWREDPVEIWLAQDSRASAFQKELEEKLDQLVEDVLARPRLAYHRDLPSGVNSEAYPKAPRKGRVADQINQTIKDLMTESPEVLMLGEDILSPYGGAFKVSRDLSEQFPDQVWTTPISEAAIVGVSTGLALGGFRPFAEIMFGDFLGLAFDQLVNHAAKFRFMYGDRVEVPLVVRTPMGGYRGYGPTHSQSLEKHLLGVPDLHVLAPNHRADIHLFYRHLATIKTPTLVIENKLLYTQFTNLTSAPGYSVSRSDGPWPTVTLAPGQRRTQATVACYGGMLSLVESVLEDLFHEEEVLVEVVAPTSLFPLELETLLESVRRTETLLVVEEGLGFCGWGSEVVTRLLEKGAPLKKVGRIHASDFVPAARQEEDQVLPNASKLKQVVLELLNG